MKTTTRLAVALTIACAGATASAQETFNIVALIATSGPASIYGGPTEKGLRLSVDNLPNKSLGGRPVKLTVYDTEGNSTKTAQLFRRAVENDQALVVIGPTTTGEALAILPMVNQLKVPTLTGGSGEAITKPVTPYMFAMPPTDRLAAEAMIASMNQRGYKKIAVLHSQDALGQSGGGIAQELVKAAGMELVTVEAFGPQDTNMTPQLLRIREKNPDAIIVWSANPGPTIVVKNALEMGLNKPIVLSQGQSSTAFITQSGPAAEGTYVAAVPIVAPDVIPDSDPRKQVVAQFGKQYKEKYGQPADQGSGHGLDAVLILESATKLIKGPLTRESLRDAIEAVKMCGSNGCRQMRPDDHRGLTKESIVVMQIRNGAFATAK
jgi:branched-chain amino acid transport system substrate-binding protein